MGTEHSTDADEAVDRQPQIRVVFATGYTANAAFRSDVARDILLKPFSFSRLADKVRQALDAT